MTGASLWNTRRRRVDEVHQWRPTEPLWRVGAVGHQHARVTVWIGSEKWELNPSAPVTSKTPPTFLLQAENDNVDTVNNSLVYYIAQKKAGVPAEMHLYAEGKHAFGLRPTELPITRWPELMETWLLALGMLPK